MIRSVKAYTDSKGNTHPSLEAAQTAEIQILLDAADNGIPSGQPMSANIYANYIVANADKFVDVLTTTEKSRPAARKVNGGKKERKKKAEAPAAELPLNQPASQQP